MACLDLFESVPSCSRNAKVLLTLIEMSASNAGYLYVLVDTLLHRGVHMMDDITMLDFSPSAILCFSDETHVLHVIGLVWRLEHSSCLWSSEAFGR